MRTVVAAEYVTLDGVMEAPACTGPYFNEELAKLQSDLLFGSDALLLGRVTYEGFAASWPQMEETEGEFAVRMNTTRTPTPGRSGKCRRPRPARALSSATTSRRDPQSCDGDR